MRKWSIAIFIVLIILILSISYFFFINQKVKPDNTDIISFDGNFNINEDTPLEFSPVKIIPSKLEISELKNN